ncbi:MAG: hypothetical protein OHK0013_30650 [Sandaracinaceae bacterium]
MSAQARLCPYCFAGTPREAAKCWLCESALPAWEERPSADHGVTSPAGARAVPKRPPTAARGGSEPDFVLWSVGTIVASLVMMMVVFDVALLGGFGLAVLAAIVCAPVLATLAVMTWLRKPGARAPVALAPPTTRDDGPPPTRRGERPESDSVRQILGVIAISVTAVAAVTLVIGLVILAILVLLFLLCLGMLGHS